MWSEVMREHNTVSVFMRSLSQLKGRCGEWLWNVFEQDGKQTLISESCVAPPVPLLLTLNKNKTFCSSCRVSAVGCGKKKSYWWQIRQKLVWGHPSGQIWCCVESPCDGRRSHAEDRTERTSCDGCWVKLLTQAACLENQALEIFLESDPSPGSSGKPAASEDVWGFWCAAPGGQTTTLQHQSPRINKEQFKEIWINNQ